MIAVLFITVLIFAMLFFSSSTAIGVRDGLENVSGLLIPSLFPFMVISSFLIRSGIFDCFGRLTAPLLRRLFRLPGEAAPAVLLSFIGGFPVGAKCVRLLLDEGKINVSQAERMMLFCVCSGPAFLITGVGTIMLHDTGAGFLLYFSQLISGLLLGILSGFISGEEKEEPFYAPEPHDTDIIGHFVLACSDAAASVLSLASMVVVFAVVLELSKQSGLSVLICDMLQFLGMDYSEAAAAFPVLLEVTAGCKTVTETGGSLCILAFATGFGGMCVHFQIFSILGDLRLGKLKWLGFRLLNASASSVIVYAVCLIRPKTVSAFALSDGTAAEFTASSSIGAAALLIMCMIFVLSLKKTELQRTFLPKLHIIRKQKPTF